MTIDTLLKLILLLAALTIVVFVVLACNRIIREKKQAGEKTGDSKLPKAVRIVIEHPLYQEALADRQAAVKRLSQLFPEGFVDPATGVIQQDYFRQLDESLRGGNIDQQDAPVQARFRLLLLFTILKHAPTTELPDILRLMGRTLALTEEADGVIRTEEARKRMCAIADLCNQVCKAAGTSYQVKVPFLGDSINTGWMDVSENRSASGIIRKIHSWAVTSSDGGTTNVCAKANVSC